MYQYDVEKKLKALRLEQYQDDQYEKDGFHRSELQKRLAGHDEVIEQIHADIEASDKELLQISSGSRRAELGKLCLLSKRCLAAPMLAMFGN